MRITNILIGLLIFTNIAFSQSSAAFWLAGGEEEQQTLPIATNGLIAYYDASNVDSYDPANPGSTWNDLSGNNYHVTNYGATHSTNYEGVFYFDGVDDYMVYEGAINEDVMTFSIWTKGSNITTNCIIDLDDINLTNNLNQELLFFNGISNDQFAIQSELSGTYELTGNSSYVINENTWYYITFTYNSGTYNLYINNVLISTTTDPSADLGAFDFFFNGYIGELFFYNRVLTSQELTDNYNATKERYKINPIISDNLIAYYDASNPESYPGTGTTWFDLSGNNYDLTLTNASQYENVNGGVIDFENELASRTGVINTQVHTISMWFNSDNSFSDTPVQYGLIDINSDEVIVHLGNSAGAVSGEDITIFNTNPTYGRTMATGAPSLANTWYYLTLTFDGSKYLIYVNGVLYSTTSGQDANASVIKNLTNLKVGSRDNFNYDFYGKIGELYFYSDRLTTEEILLNYNNTKVRYSSSGPVWDGSQTGILDDYSGAAAAYSVRALNSAYTSPLMTIRRASDNAETDVYALASGDLDQAWINSFCSGTDCFVVTWYDQSGNGYNATATVVNQPVIYTAGSVITEGGKPAMDFDGSNDHFNISNNVMPLNEFYYSEIFNGIGTGLARAYNWGAFYSNKASSTLKHRINIGVSGSTEASVSSSNSYNGRTLKTVLYNKINLTLAVNSTDLNSTAANFTILYNANDAPTIGALKNTSGNVAVLLNGNLQELIIYHSDQSTNRASIESNINSYYSIY